MNIKEIKGFEDYFISDEGDVYSGKRGFRKRKPVPDKNGYTTVSLSPDGNLTRKTLKVHRLVASAFIQSDIGDLEVNHLNGIKNDNRLENLELVSHRDNMAHASDSDLLCRGEDRPSNKFSEDQIREVCRLLQDTDLFISKVAEATSVSETTCRGIYYGKKWQHIAKDYVFDRNKRKRGRGSLNEDQIREVCRLVNSGLGTKDISEKLGISYDKISKIKNKNTYTRITSQYLHAAPTTIESTSEDGSE